MKTMSEQVCARPSAAPCMSTSRTERLFRAYRSTPRSVSTDRARLFTEAFRANRDDPLPIRRAKAYREVLERIPIAIHPDELLVGGTTDRQNGAILFPETNPSGMRPSGCCDSLLKSVVSAAAAVLVGLLGFLMPHSKSRLSLIWFLIDRSFDSFETRPTQTFGIEARSRKELFALIRYWKPKSAYNAFRKLLSAGQRRRQAQFSFTAESQFIGGLFLFNADIGSVVTGGLSSLTEQARTRMAQAADSESSVYHESVVIAAEGLAAYAGRYADLADRLAASTLDNETRDEYKQIARICRTVPFQPAKDFREAFQSVWFTYLGLLFDDGGMEIPFGRLDQILAPSTGPMSRPVS